LIRNTQPHQAWVKSQPPRIGPSGSETNVAAAMIPTARGRSASLNITGSVANPITISPAPATPRNSRAAMNAPLDGEAAHAAEPTANRKNDASSTFLRP
jgi:hypothetical protein